MPPAEKDARAAAPTVFNVSEDSKKTMIGTRNIVMMANSMMVAVVAEREWVPSLRGEPLRAWFPWWARSAARRGSAQPNDILIGGSLLFLDRQTDTQTDIDPHIRHRRSRV